MDGVVVVSGRSRLLQRLLAALSSSSPAPVICKKKKKKSSCSKLVLHLELEDGAYECRSCGRRFRTFQALGGHRTSHNRRPPPAGSRKLGKAERSLLEHRCGTCGLVFGTGQALGGHMRRHFKRPPANIMAAAAWSSGSGGREEEDDHAWKPRLIQFI